MKKPTNYDNTEVSEGFTPLKLGGHICKIMQVKETKSRSGLEMLEISLDIAEGDQKDYYANAYRSDTRQDKKWGCIVYLVTDDSTEYGTKNLKTFVSCVEKSNKGFNTSWGDKFAVFFKGKLVGGVFGREQYRNNSGEIKFSTKCRWFRSIDAIKDGVEVPEDKLLPDAPAANNSNTGFTYGPENDGFMNIPDGMDEELPFMS